MRKGRNNRMKTLYVNSVKRNQSLVDGPGVRTVVFLQGCDIHCKGCQNKSTWDMSKGVPVSTGELAALLRNMSKNGKVTISGGEPLMQVDALAELLENICDMDVALYTGHSFDEVPDEILSKLKYIKTGAFKHECKTTVMPYVGSTNQQFRRLR